MEDADAALAAHDVAGLLPRVAAEELLPTSESIPSIVALLLRATLRRQQLPLVRWLRKALSKEERPPILEVISAGALPKLVEILSQPNEGPLHFEAAWVITNIVSGDTVRFSSASSRVPRHSKSRALPSPPSPPPTHPRRTTLVP